MGDYYSQKIINDDLSFFRAFANGYFWIKHLHYNIENRNIGYYSNLQTDMANYFRSNVIDWINDTNNKEQLDKIGLSDKNKQRDFIKKITINGGINSNGINEMSILEKIYGIPIIIYDKYNAPINLIMNGNIYSKNEAEKKIDKIEEMSKFIVIKHSSVSLIGIPISIETLYYKK